VSASTSPGCGGLCIAGRVIAFNGSPGNRRRRHPRRRT
jgi:hypothetical protein